MLSRRFKLVCLIVIFLFVGSPTLLSLITSKLPIINSNPVVKDVQKALSIPASFATSFPVTAREPISTEAALAVSFNRLACYSEGYYFIFYTNYSTAAENRFGSFYISSSNGITWSSPTILPSTNSSTYEEGGLTSYCDSSGNVYVAYSLTASGANDEFSINQGTSSGGVISWSYGSPVTLECGRDTGGSGCQSISIYAFSTSDIWLAATDHLDEGEAWSCQTSPCSSSANWAFYSSGPSFSCLQTCQIIGLGSSSDIAFVAYAYTPEELEVMTTSNSGSSWSSSVVGPSLLANTFLNGGNCVAISTTLYCIISSGTNPVDIEISTFTLGGSSWTTTQIDSFNTGDLCDNGPMCSYKSIGTDGSALYAVYNDYTNSSSSESTIDYQTSTNGGVSWSGRQTLVSSENTVEWISSVPTLQNGQEGIIWAALSGSNSEARFYLTPSAYTEFSIKCLVAYSLPYTPFLSISGTISGPSTAYCNGSPETGYFASAGATITATEPSANSTSRWYFTSGTTTTFSASNTTWSITNYQQLEQNFRWLPPVACPLVTCGSQVPEIFYYSTGSGTSAGLSSDSTTSPSSYIALWMDNTTSWSTSNVFYYDLNYYSPNSTGTTPLTPQDFTLTYSASVSGSCTGTNTFNLYEHQCWVPAFIDTYGNLIGVQTFLAVLWLVIASVILIKSGNPVLSVTVGMIGFATFSAAVGGVGNTPYSFLSNDAWRLLLLFLALAGTGVAYRLMSGKQG